MKSPVTAVVLGFAGVLLAIPVITAVNVAVTLSVLSDTFGSTNPVLASQQQQIDSLHRELALSYARNVKVEQPAVEQPAEQAPAPATETKVTVATPKPKRYTYLVITQYPSTVYHNQSHYNIQSSHDENYYANTNTNVNVHNQIDLQGSGGTSETPVAIETNVNTDSNTTNKNPSNTVD